MIQERPRAGAFPVSWPVHRRRAFERSFILPESVQEDAIRAECVNVVLRLVIPKSEEAKPRTRQIDIQ
jgi:HSP20 family molecular chaperone IbpA